MQNNKDGIIIVGKNEEDILTISNGFVSMTESNTNKENLSWKFII